MSWSEKLGEIIIDARKLTEQQLRAGMIDAANTVILGSPVGNPDLWIWNHPEFGYVDYLTYRDPPPGYKGGTYRSNHRISFTGVSSTERSRSGIGVLQRRVVTKMEGFKMGKNVYVTNPLPYARRLEYGWSTQAGDGVYRPAIKRLVRFLNNELKAK